ncbi:MAG: MarR family transcriptional regulator [Deinococcales bacterium]
MSSASGSPRDPRLRPRAEARLAVLAWMRLARVYGETMHALAALLRPHGLSVAEFDVLAQLGPRDGITQRELAARLLVTQANVTYHMHRLTRHGLVERHRDGRHKRLRLTPAGRALHDRVVPLVEGWHAEHFGRLGAGDTRILVSLLRALRAPPTGSQGRPLGGRQGGTQS